MAIIIYIFRNKNQIGYKVMEVIMMRGLEWGLTFGITFGITFAIAWYFIYKRKKQIKLEICRKKLNELSKVYKRQYGYNS